MAYLWLIPAAVFGTIFGAVVFGIVPTMLGFLLIGTPSDFNLMWPIRYGAWMGLTSSVLVTFLIIRDYRKKT